MLSFWQGIAGRDSRWNAMADEFESSGYDRGEHAGDTRAADAFRQRSGTETVPDNAEGLELIEVAGRIKWFDVAKGFGFIVPDDDMPDVLLHVTCLRRDGYQTANEGARIVCEAVKRPRGFQAFRIISLDETGAVHPSELPSRTHVSITPTSGLEQAVVKWFNRLRGFGFLSQGPDRPDIFVHMETLRRFGLMQLNPGDTVLVRYGPGPKGLMAAEVRPLDGGLAPSSH
jgi:CspA family cold shock protein